MKISHLFCLIAYLGCGLIEACLDHFSAARLRLFLERAEEGTGRARTRRARAPCFEQQGQWNWESLQWKICFLEQHARRRPRASRGETSKHHFATFHRWNRERRSRPRSSKVTQIKNLPIKLYLAFQFPKETHPISSWISNSSSKKRRS